METTVFWGLSTLVIYPALFMGALVGAVLWNKSKRGAHRPFGSDVKLLRMPGEHLWRRVMRKDMSEMPWTICLVLVPIILAGFGLQIASVFFGKTYTTMLIGLAVFLIAMCCCVFWLAGRIERREREYLGFFGERVVADSLEPMKVKGWFIVHDVPCSSGNVKFNLDHVAVGPGGIWVVETKTRRKGRARMGKDRNKVLFDGTKIIWPRFDDTRSVKQTASHANWLQEWLETATGRTFEVSAVVAIPGYEVEVIGKSGVRAAAPKDLPNVLIGEGKAVLPEEDIKLVWLQLAGRCRDVEY
jgi:hypothetical protein